jgi:hypothetical protein
LVGDIWKTFRLFRQPARMQDVAGKSLPYGYE